MHGSVFLGNNEKALRPALLWNDQRTQEQCDEIRRLYNDVMVLAPRVIARRWSILRLARKYQIAKEVVELVLKTSGGYPPPGVRILLPPAHARSGRKPQTEQERRMATVDWESARVARRAGKTYTALAKELGTTGRTVKNHLRKLEGR